MTKNRFGDFFHPIFAVDLVYDFMISVNNVSVVFGGFYLLDSVSFLFNKKELFGVNKENDSLPDRFDGKEWSREIDDTEDVSRFTNAV